MNKYAKLSYCGIYCGGCRNYKENMNCQGCRAELEMLSDCPTKACAEAKGLLYCGECPDFPCNDLKDFYNDGAKHHALAFENIRSIKANDPDSWLAEQETQYTCSCGRKLYWLEESCCHANDSD